MCHAPIWGCDPYICKIQGGDQRTPKEYCTLLSESPFITLQNGWQRGREPSKILTRLRVPFRANFGAILDVLLFLDVKFKILMPAVFRIIKWFLRQNPSKTAKIALKMPCFGAKTSDFFGKNIRTLWPRSPMFPVFQPEMPPKSPFLQFCDIWTQGRSWWLSRPFSAR